MYVTGIFSISWIFLGNYVLLNLFLAILLDSVTQNFSDKEVIQNQEDENDEPSNQASLKVQNSFVNKLTIFPSNNKFVVNREAGERIMDELSKFKGEKAKEFANSINIDKMKKKTVANIPSPTNIRRSSYRAAVAPIKSMDQLYCANSFFLFSKSNKFRLFSNKMVSHVNFERFMNLIIVASSLILVIETYLDFDSNDDIEVFLVNFCTITNIILAVVYSIEILLKGTTYGLFLDRRSYLRNAWNFLDFMLSVCYISDTFLPENSESIIIKVKFCFVLFCS